MYQEAVDTSAGEHLCSHTPSHLADVIYSNFGESGAAMCCKRDGCNKDMPARYLCNNFVFVTESRSEQRSSTCVANLVKDQHIYEVVQLDLTPFYMLFDRR